SVVWAYAGRSPVAPSAGPRWEEGRVALGADGAGPAGQRLPAGMPVAANLWGGDDAAVVADPADPGRPLFRFDRAEGEPNVPNSPANSCDVFRIVDLASLQRGAGVGPAADRETILELSAAFTDDRPAAGDPVEFGCRVYAFRGDPAVLRATWPAVLRDVASVGTAYARSGGGNPAARIPLTAKSTLPAGVDYVVVHLFVSRPGRSSVVPAEFGRQFVGDVRLALRHLPAAERKP
ncbi:MAG TPA: hypothetical protein VF796_00900, partial [Humisphaera sp.]